MSFPSKLVGLLFLVLLVSAFSFADLFAGKSYKDINNKELSTLIKQDKITIIDIRRPEEWRQTGIIKDSKLLTLFDKRGRMNPNFIQKIHLLPKNTPIALICRTGARTRVASKYLSKELGYTNIYNVKNGITYWKIKNNPVVSGKQGTKL